MTNKLYIGSKFFGHDSSIFAVLPDRKEIFAISTERLTRYKHDSQFPILPLKKLLDYCQLDPLSITEVYFGGSFVCQKDELFDKDYYRQEMLHRKFMAARFIGEYAGSIRRFAKLGRAARLRSYLKKPLGWYLLGRKLASRLPRGGKVPLDSIIHSTLSEMFPNARIRVNHYDHEYCHAVSSYLPSRFSSALLVTMDGYGDDNCFSRAYLARDGKLTKVAESLSPQRFLHLPSQNGGQITVECSIGGLYSYFTELLGYVPNADEGKVEALAALGKPVADVFEALKSATRLNTNNLSVDISYEGLDSFLHSEGWRQALANAARENLAATIQTYAEDSILEYVRLLVERTGETKLCLSGGVFANVIINLKIFEQITKSIYIVPAVADDGSAQGAAFSLLMDDGIAFEELGWIAAKAMPYFGTSYDRKSVKERLEKFGDAIQVEDMGADWPRKIAQRLAAGEIGALFHGRMEWGPRALGNRSIIADARNKDAKHLINDMIKKREPFQPFCPSILAEEKDRLFDGAYLNKHMTSAFGMKREFWDVLPGAIHVDGTARVQFVQPEDNPSYYALLAEVKRLTGYGVVLNTSFNKHGRTIVEKPEDAVEDFLDTNLSYLLVEGFLVTRAAS